MKNISEVFSFEGKQLVCSHQSLVNNCEMTFAACLFFSSEKKYLE